MLKHNRAIIFDLDGTLLDTIEDLADSVNTALKTQGFPIHDVEKYYSFVGNGINILVQRALPEQHCDNQTISNSVKMIREIYSEQWKNKTRPFPGIQSMLDDLYDQDIPLAVFSNKPDEFTQVMVQEFFPEIEFEAVLGQSAVIPAKPDPAGALMICEQIRMLPESFLFVGDSDVDMITAANAGMIPIGVSWGFRSTQELKDNGAYAVIDQPAELLDFVTKAGAE
ncbi:MAG: HAD family hydrolase [FCB group bacterium]|nr:HAD family hydrolase [FCB group bacterium]